MLITHLVEHVRRQADHGKVVNNEDDLQINRRPVSHEPGAEPHHAEVEEEDEGYWDGGVDQQPRVCPVIWEGTDSTLTYTDTLMHSCSHDGLPKSASLSFLLSFTLLVAGACCSYTEIPRYTIM